MKKVLSIFILLIFLSGHLAFAEEAEDVGTEPVYSFPELSPEFDIFLGYRFVDYDDSKRAEEFEYLDENSVTGAADIRIFKMPHRLHLDLDVKNQYDYFGDLSYAYKDLIIFRGITRNIFHNLENINLDPLESNAQVDQTDSRDQDYDTRVNISDIKLRVKAPDFPLHVFGNARFVNKKGTIQQRFLGGAAYFNDLVRTTEERDIDWNTQEYQVGINSHIRWIEAEYSYSQKNFTAGGDDEPYYSYGDAGFFPPASVRAAGTYPHNVIPDTKGQTHKVKLHTNYTGKLVASASFSNKDRKNEDSKAKATYTSGAGSITYMPWTPLTFFVKYKHSERDMDNPDSVTIADQNDPTNTYGDSDVRKSVSAKSDRISLIGRYRPISKIALKAGYEYENYKREDYEDWHILQESTKKNIFYVAADSRITNGMKLKLKYKYTGITDPSYNIQPDSSNEGKASLSWLIHPRISTFLSYTLATGERDNLVYWDDPDIVESPNKRKEYRDMFFGTVSFIIVKDLYLTGSYAHMYNRIKEDLYYHDSGGNGLFDEKVDYKTTADNYVATLQYRLNDRLDLFGEVSHTQSKGKFDPDDDNLTIPVSVAQYSDLKVEETAYKVSGSYTLRGGFVFGGSYKYSQFDDVEDNIWDDVEDGTAQIIWLYVGKKWG
jgi:hypothetical protein